MNEQKEIRIALMGESGCGKTTFISKWKDGIFKSEYVATALDETAVSDLSFHVRTDMLNRSIISRIDAEVFELAGWAGTEYQCRDPQGIIIMGTKIEQMASYFRSLNVKHRSNVVFVLSKIDTYNTTLISDYIFQLKKLIPVHYPCQYTYISSLCDINVNEPFLCLLKRLYGSDVIH